MIKYFYISKREVRFDLVTFLENTKTHFSAFLYKVALAFESLGGEILKYDR